MNTDPPATGAERYPTLTPDGERTLRFLREHPHAPIYRNESGNRLTADDVEAAHAFECGVRDAPISDQRPEASPAWLRAFVAHCLETVPFYRRYGSPPARLADLPTISRADLSRDVAQFVPDDVPTGRMMHFSTSGTTGHPLLVPSHPLVAANYLAFHKRALRRVGIELRAGRGQVGVVLLGWQRRCFTYVSVTPTMDEAGLAKINLHPDDWRHPDDRAAYLDALQPEVFAGDPISFAELLKLPLQGRPRACLSTAMALLPGLRRALEERFRCPVLDLYSMNEAGPIAVADPEKGGHVLLQPRLLVEILSPDDNPLPPGERGEITLTGGFNPCLPLLRYRTGDYAALRLDSAEPVLAGLEGRPPVRYRTTAGEWINNLEITHALGPLTLSQYALHQDAAGALSLVYCGAENERTEIQRALEKLFGAGQTLDTSRVDGFEGKVVQYTSSLEGATHQP